MTLSTIKSIYLGQQELFKGLWIEEQWNWEQVHPVIHISFSSVDYQGSGLDIGIQQMLRTQATLYDVGLSGTTIKTMFAELPRKLADRNRVVLLIDEYDKPIIDYLDEVEQAKAN